MKVEFERYVNATKGFPLEFEDNGYDGYDTSDIQNAGLYETEEEAMQELERFDSPDTRQIIKVKITYEF